MLHARLVSSAVLLLSLAAISLSCASAYMRGSEPVDEPPMGIPAIHFRVSSCTDLATQKPIALPGPLLYWLITDPGPRNVLYEQDPEGNVTRIFNHWVQEDGADVFFTWVAQSSGWQWVIPADRSGGVRFVYLHGAFKSFPDGEVSKVAGTAALLCNMIRD
jgi:hypothetical protein